MLSITKLKMWKDPGYTRQCVEVPPVGSKKLPAPDYESSETLRPRRGALLNAVELPLSYLEVHEMSYLYMEISDGKETPNTMTVFGWILSVEETASSNEAVIIRWTPDYWRTYSDQAVFGKGTVTRCNNATYKRPFLTQPRKWLVDTKGVGVEPYQFIAIVSEMTGDDVTGFSYYWGTLGDSWGTERTPSVTELYSGNIDEILGVVPSSIIGIWVVANGILTSTMFSSTTEEVINHVHFNKSIGLTTNLTHTVIGAIASGSYSDDMTRVVGVDPYGVICSELPWGYGFESGNATIVVDIATDGITWYMIPSEYDVSKALAEGSYLSFSGLSIPVNANAWSEYAYTYQRSYDKRMAEIQRNQRAVSGISSTGTSIVGGAIAGASKGGAGGLVGGAMGGILGIIGAGIDYFTAPYFNDEIQTETDKLVSNQTSNLIAGGGGFGWKGLAKYWRPYLLKADATSLAEYTAKITNDGYTVEIPVGTPTAFLTTGGPIQIQNLVLTGSIPPEAKTYIKNILSNGVRIVENNPTGTDPGEESP